MTPGAADETNKQRLAAARERLEAALRRLEKMAADRTVPERQGEAEKLAQEITALRGENERLSRNNKVMGERLDGAIGRLKSVLDVA